MEHQKEHKYDPDIDVPIDCMKYFRCICCNETEQTFELSPEAQRRELAGRDEWFDQNFIEEEDQRKKPRINMNNYSDGNKYFITLTACPEVTEKPSLLVEAIKKILKQKAFKITYGYGVIELTKQGMPHAHIYIECKAYIRLQMIKRQWKKSSVDLKRVKKDNGIRDYQDKDRDNKELASFLHKHNLERVIVCDVKK